ncbi:Arm DNA-binding domain-containing protein [Sphingomonas sp. RT2P30]|uniref:Arm DNA-binding domain-containing protein n=1 Tax=Parasphingomonas halimpatiens TaxID=3096162 RepID=UPI002FC6FFB8
MGRLSATAAKAEKRPGRQGDGDGLFLMVSGSGAKCRVCRVQKNGRRRDIGLGSAAKVSLAQAGKRPCYTARRKSQAGCHRIPPRACQ